MKTAIVKRSIVIDGHKTSVSLEDDFWDALRDIAGRKGVTLSALTQQIDHARQNNNLSSAIRVYVLGDIRSRAKLDFAAPKQGHAGNGAAATA